MNYLVGEDGAEYKGMTFELATTGFELHEYAGGYHYCSLGSEKTLEGDFTIKNGIESCKEKCRPCSFLTYYEGLETEYAKRCYVFKSAAECGRLTSYEDGSRGVWSVPVGVFNRTTKQYRVYERPVVWPGQTMDVPADYFSGEPSWMDWHRPLFGSSSRF